MSAAEELIAKAQAKREAQRDPAQHNHEAPPGYRLRGVSTLLDGDGNVRATWVKTAKAADDLPGAVLDAFALAVAERELPARAVIAKPRPRVPLRSDLLAVYPMGDPHLGMLAWREETGDDFDLRIAETQLCTAVDKLVTLAPASKKALLINVGDFFHTDSGANRTERSGHALDVDGRWAKLLRVGIYVMCRCIDRALEKHETVRVINEIGNHDDRSSIMLSTCLSHHYRDNPRVEIDLSPSHFHWAEFGKCLIGVTHGDGPKPEALPGIMAHDQPEAWGRTKHRYWYTGHVHHSQVKEFPGVIFESFRTLAARDAWHHASGYRAGRSMSCIVLHETHGEVTRHTVGVEAL